MERAKLGVPVSSEDMKAMWEGQANVFVAVRVRPLLKHDNIKRSCVRTLDSNVVIIMDPASNDKQDILRANRSKEKQYAFDQVFDINVPQEGIYLKTSKSLIHGVLDGYNATVFCYGQTGSGKTHTMIGNSLDPGIMVRIMSDLFVHSTKQGNKQGVVYKVSVSFLEVYNENIRDLLSDVEEYLDLREDPIKGPMVAGITEIEAFSGEEIMNLLLQGNNRRAQAATAANEVSSRSHAVLQVLVECRDKAPGVVSNIKVGKLSLVDLAGSERAANTKNTGVRLTEGANINRSLLALGNCINALSGGGEGNKSTKGNFVPYRDSKLTRLLKDSLGGNCRTVMIANISSSEASFEETLNTLKYANRAKNIRTTLQRNVMNVNFHISEYVHLIDKLRAEIKILKDQIGGGGPNDRVSTSNLLNGMASLNRNASMPAFISTGGITAGGALLPTAIKIPPSPAGSIVHFPSTPLGGRDNVKSAGDNRAMVNIMRQRIVENFQERMQLRRSLIELEDQNVQNSIEVSKRQLLVVQWIDHNKPAVVDQSSEAKKDDKTTTGNANSTTDTENDIDNTTESDTVTVNDDITVNSSVSTSAASHNRNSHHHNNNNNNNSSLMTTEKLISTAPDNVRDAWAEVEQLRTAMTKNNAIKKNIGKRLKHNEKEADKVREELDQNITGEDRKELMELQYQVGRLELENMELEQHRIVHESIVQGKDLVIQKLMLQLAVKDKLLRHQRQILQDHDLLSEVGSWQLNLINEHAASSGVGIYSSNDMTVPLPNVDSITSTSALKIPIEFHGLSVKETARNDDNDYDDDDDSNSSSSNQKTKNGNNGSSSSTNNKNKKNNKKSRDKNSSVKSYYEMPISSSTLGMTDLNDNNLSLLTSRTFNSTGNNDTQNSLDYDAAAEDNDSRSVQTSSILKKTKPNDNHTQNNSYSNYDNNDDYTESKYKLEQQQHQQTQGRNVRIIHDGNTGTGTGTNTVVTGIQAQGVARWGRRSYHENNSYSNNELAAGRSNIDSESTNNQQSNTYKNNNNYNNNNNNNHLHSHSNQQLPPPNFSIAGNSVLSTNNNVNGNSQSSLNTSSHASVTNINSLMMKNNNSIFHNNNKNEKEFENASITSNDDINYYNKNAKQQYNNNNNINNSKSPLILPSTIAGASNSQLSLKGIKTGGGGQTSSSFNSQANNNMVTNSNGVGSGANGAQSLLKRGSSQVGTNKMSTSYEENEFNTSDDDNTYQARNVPVGVSGVGLGVKTNSNAKIMAPSSSTMSSNSSNLKNNNLSSQQSSNSSSSSNGNGEMHMLTVGGGMSLSTRVSNKIKQVLPSAGNKFGKVFHSSPG